MSVCGCVGRECDVTCCGYDACCVHCNVETYLQSVAMMCCAVAGSSCQWSGVLWDGLPQRLVLRAWYELGQSSQVSGRVRQQRHGSVWVRFGPWQEVFVHDWVVQVSTRPGSQYNRRRLHVWSIFYCWESPGQTTSHHQHPTYWPLQVWARWQGGELYIDISSRAVLYVYAVVAMVNVCIYEWQHSATVTTPTVVLLLYI